MSPEDILFAAAIIAAGVILVAFVSLYAALRRAWVVPVLVLSLPAVISALLLLVLLLSHLELREGFVMWIWLAGVVGPGLLGLLFTPAALIVTLVGSFRRAGRRGDAWEGPDERPARVKLAMWAIVVPSLLAFAFLLFFLRP